IVFDGETAQVYRLPSNVPVFQQKIFGAKDDISIEQFINETKEAFGKIAKLFNESEKQPVLVVDYNNCVYGDAISLKLLQINANDIFTGLKSRDGKPCIIYATGMTEGFAFNLIFNIGGQILSAANYANRVQKVPTLKLAIDIADTVINGAKNQP